MTERKRRIGFVGLPPEEILAPRRRHELIDLDNLVDGVRQQSEAALPRTTCRILRRIFDNALALPLDEIVIDEGYGKCDAARGLADVLEATLSIPIVRTQNDNRIAAGTPISDSELPLRRKVELILDGLMTPSEGPGPYSASGLQSQDPAPRARGFAPTVSGLKSRDTNGLIAPPSPAVGRFRCPTPDTRFPIRAAFWGVPAADFRVYELFPDGTQVLGWTRCLENRTPSDWELETWVPTGVPVVFFAQTFCAKNILAQHLAKRHGGLYVDVDGVLSQPVRAKIEAYLRFRGAWD